MSEWHDEILDGFDAALEMTAGSGQVGACSFTWPVDRVSKLPATGSKVYDCIGTSSQDALALMAGGMMADYEFTLTCRRQDFDTVPLSGDLILRNGRLSRIIRPEPSDVSPLLLLHCGTPHK